MPNPANIHFTPYWLSPLDDVARFVIEHATQLPDLNDTTLVLAEPRAAPALRRALLDAAQARGIQALLGVKILSFEQWLAPFVPDAIRVCTQQERLLILVDALFERPTLLGQANAWTLADSLLDLFDELSLNHIQLDSTAEAFSEQLAQWYALSQADLSGLQHEARLVHNLWQAWHAQLQANRLIDPSAAHAMALQNTLKQQACKLHLVGIEAAHRVQREWLDQIVRFPDVQLWLHGTLASVSGNLRSDAALRNFCREMSIEPGVADTADPYHTSMNMVYSETPALRARAEQLCERVKQSAISSRIGVFSARDAEQEAQAIDVRCRQWLLQGKQHIAIVTDNRRLARRVRALLERAGIVLQDAAGWALSTTRAAAGLEALLQCIEEDFAKDALLDLLKSPFVYPEMEREQLKNLVYRLEHDIIRNEGIRNGLDRYRKAILDRSDRLRDIWNVPPSAVSALLQRLEDACRPLIQVLRRPSQRASLLDFVNALHTVLLETGLYAAFRDDEAGVLILQIIEEMQRAGQSFSQPRPWRDFRAWLGRNLEKRYFRPASQASVVSLLSLEQSQLQHFDGLILAAAEADYLPGGPALSPFFNNAVRAQLGLTTRDTFMQQRLRNFYRLLHSAETILITHRLEQDGSPVSSSPWLAALVDFHQLAYQSDLQAHDLHTLLRSGQTQVRRWDSDLLPPRQHQPRVTIQPGLLPTVVSASDYQSLLDCPFQFFAARCLNLRPPEEVRQVLSKREYGERVHLCLEAFHGDKPGYPGPFTQDITEANRAEAIAVLERISDAVFAQDLRDNYLHRGWYQQWRDTIPAYIEWQMRRNRELRVHDTEHRSESQLDENVTIKGRLDRIDGNAQGYAVLDYKTGSIPKKFEIENGEKIQLPFYALLAQNENLPVNRVEYLEIGKAGEVASKFTQQGEHLQELSTRIGERLRLLMQQLHEGRPAPAWENKDSCQYCDMGCLCRVGGWADDAELPKPGQPD